MALVQRLARGADCENCAIILVSDAVSSIQSRRYFGQFVENVVRQKGWSDLEVHRLILDGRIFGSGDDRRKSVDGEEVLSIKGGILAIDDLVPLILNHGLSKTATFLTKKFKKVIARCTTDLIGQKQLLSILSLANITVNILENYDDKLWKFTSPTKQLDTTKSLVSRVRLCTGQGRVVSSVIGVAVGDEGIEVVNIEKKTHVERILKDRGEEEQERTLKKSAVPMSTFNMGIKSHEDDARKSIVLPFQNDSKIEYTPDDGDDFDDSDPDDDLDI